MAASFAKQSAYTLLANLTLAAIGFATGIVSARLLGPAGKGELAAIQGWPMLWVSWSMLGLPEAIIYFGSSRRQELGRIATSGFALVAITGTLAAIVGWWTLPLLLKAQSPSVIRCARFFLSFVYLNILTGLPLFILRAQLRLELWNVLRVVSAAAWPAVLAFAWFSRASVTACGLALQLLFATAAVGLLIFAGTLRLLPRPLAVDAKLWQPMSRFGVFVVLGSLPQYLNLRLDQLLMAGMMEPSILGIYVVAVSWAAALMPITSAISSIVFPRVAASQGDVRTRLRMIYRAAVAAVVATASCGCILILVTQRFVRLLYGEAFLAAVPACYILIGGNVVISLINVLEEGLKGLGRPRFILYAETVGLLVTVSLLPFLLTRFLTVGAAAASILAYLATAATLLICIRMCAAETDGTATLSLVEAAKINVLLPSALDRD